MIVEPEVIGRYLANPEELLAEDEEAQLALACFIEAPVSLLKLLLANSYYPDVAAAIRNHVSYPGDNVDDFEKSLADELFLSSLGQSDDVVIELLKFAPVPAALIRKGSVPAKLLVDALNNNLFPPAEITKTVTRLVTEATIKERAELAISEETPPNVVELLAGDLLPVIHSAARENVICSTMLVKLIDDHQDFASDKTKSAEELDLLGRSCWPLVRFAVANNDEAPLTILQRLARDPNARIRLAVALNPRTTQETLQLLSLDPDEHVVQAVIRHPRTSDQTLLSLIHSKSAGLLRARPQISDGLWDALSEDPDCWHVFLQRRDTPHRILAKIAERSDLRRFSSIAQHPNTDSDTLDKLAAKCSDPQMDQTTRREIMLSVACHHNTDRALRDDLWEQLCADSDVETHRALSRCSALPARALTQLTIGLQPYELAMNRMRMQCPDLPEMFFQELQLFLSGYDSVRILYEALIAEESRTHTLASWAKVLQSLTNEQCDTLKHLLRKPLLAATLSGSYSSRECWVDNDTHAQSLLAFTYSLACSSSIADIDREVAINVLKNPKTEEALLARVENHLRRFADRSSTPLDMNRLIDIAMAASPNLPQSSRARYAEKILDDAGDGDGPRALAKEQNLALETLRKLLKLGLLSPSAIVEQLHQWPHDLFNEVVQHMVSAPRDLSWMASQALLTEEHLHAIACLINEHNAFALSEVLRSLSTRPLLSASDFRRLAQIAVASVECVESEKTLAALQDGLRALNHMEMSDSSSLLRLAKSPQTTSSLLYRIADSPDKTVQLAVIAHINVDCKTLLKLVFSTDETLRLSLAQSLVRKKLPLDQMQKILSVLASDISRNVRTIAASCTHTSPEDLEQLAEGSDARILRAVAGNMSTPEHTLTELSLKNIVDLKNPSLPESIIVGEFDKVFSKYQPSAPVTEVLAVMEGGGNRILLKQTRLSQATQNPYQMTSELKQLLQNQPWHQKIPPSMLRRLSRFHDSPQHHHTEEIRLLVAQHPGTSPEILDGLALDVSSSVEMVVASHTNTPASALGALAKSVIAQNESSVKLSQVLLSRTSIPPEVFELLSTDQRAVIRRAVAAHARVPGYVLTMMAQKENRLFVLDPVARNPNLNSDAITTLLKKDNDDINQLLCAHKSTPDSVLKELLESKSVAVRLTAAQQRHERPQWWYLRLADDPSLEVRQMLAGNPSCPAFVLDLIARSDVHSQFRVACNQQTEAETLAWLFEAGDRRTRLAVLANPNTPVEISRREPAPVTTISADKSVTAGSITTRKGVQGSSLNTIVSLYKTDPVAALTACANSPVPIIRMSGLMHPLAPEPILSAGAKSLYWSDRYAVAVNHNTPQPLLAELLHDANRIVRKAANLNKKQSI